jgi:hypothetical protein
MKYLSKEAKRVMDILTELAKDDHVKIDNRPGSFMAVVIEKLHDLDNGPVYSVSHYYEQNGDLMSDPDVTFLKMTSNGRNFYFPLTYRQDNLGIDRELATYDESGRKIIGCYKKIQEDTASFCTVWMRNIKHQQRL